VLTCLEAKIQQEVLGRLQDDYPKITSSHGSVDNRNTGRKLRKRRKKKLPQITVGFRGKGRRKRVRLEDSVGVAAEALIGGEVEQEIFVDAEGDGDVEMAIEEEGEEEVEGEVEAEVDVYVDSPDAEEEEDDDAYEPDEQDSQ
jgi:hypothetical protein